MASKRARAVVDETLDAISAGLVDVQGDRVGETFRQRCESLEAGRSAGKNR